MSSMTLFLHFFLYIMHFFSSKISHMYLLQKKARVLLFVSFCSVLVIGGIVLLFRNSCAKLANWGRLNLSSLQHLSVCTPAVMLPGINWPEISYLRTLQWERQNRSETRLKESLRGGSSGRKRRCRITQAPQPGKVTINIQPTNK